MKLALKTVFPFKKYVQINILTFFLCLVVEVSIICPFRHKTKANHRKGSDLAKLSE